MKKKEMKNLQTIKEHQTKIAAPIATTPHRELLQKEAYYLS